MPSSRGCGAERNESEVQAALDALTEGAKGNANLLDLAVKAARKKATVGEISYALEKVFTRHKAEIRAISGVYKKEAAMNPSVDRVRKLVEHFDKNDGRRPRILIAKLGQDGHDRGQKVIASAFADLGFDVDIGPLFATADEAARQAVENDVHVVGVSSLTAGHLTLVPELESRAGQRGSRRHHDRRRRRHSAKSTTTNSSAPAPKPCSAPARTFPKPRPISSKSSMSSWGTWIRRRRSSARAAVCSNAWHGRRV